MLVSVYDTLRSAGRDLVLEPGARESLPALIAELEDAARCLAGDVDATAPQRKAAGGVLDLLATTSLPERLLELEEHSARGARAATYEEARKALRAAALEELAARDRELLQELLTGFAGAYAAAKDRESALDFEDLQLRARDLLRDHAAVRETEQLRFRSIMVDEFQDTNRLQTDLIDLLAAGAEKELFFVGDEFQSIYGFRHADVAVFRERREAAPQVLPLTLNYRSRPEVLAAVNELFATEFGGDFQPLAPRRGLRRTALRYPRRAARHGQGLVLGHRRCTGGVPRPARWRGGCGSSSTRARRRPGRSCCCSPRAPTPSGSRRSCARSTCPRTG